MKRLLFIFLLLISTGLFAQEHYYLLTGTYTRRKSKGIYVYDFNSKDGSTVLIDSAIKANPSYLAVSPDERFVYAVNEEGSPTRAGKVKAYAFDKKKGSLSPLNEQSSKGD